MGTKTIWDGKDLPPVGSWVLIELASVKDKKLPYKVEGYAVRRLDDMPTNHFLIDIKLRSRDNVPNQRMLGDVYPVDDGVKYD